MCILTEQDAARYLALSVRTLQKRRFQCKQSGYFRLGKSIRYSQQELDRFLEAHRITPAGEGEPHLFPTSTPDGNTPSQAVTQPESPPARRFTPAKNSRCARPPQNGRPSHP